MPKVKRGIILIIWIFLLISSVSKVQGVQIWADDFNDKDLDGWDIKSYYSATLRSGGVFEESNSGFSVADGNLKSANILADDYASQTNMSHANHVSTVAYGTWSFDWIVSEDKRSYNVIAFMTTDTMYNYNWTGHGIKDLQFTGYALRLISYNTGNHPRGIDIFKYCLKPANFVCDNEGFVADADLEGTYHIDITREVSGNFKIYIDSELKIEYLDNEYQTSEKFTVTSFQGSSAIDNIVVYDEIRSINNPLTTSSTSEVESSNEDNSTVPFYVQAFAIMVPIILKRSRSNS